MHTEIITVITTRIDLDTFTPTTSVAVECEDPLPHDVIYTAVAASCRAAANEADRNLSKQKKERVDLNFNDSDNSDDI